jgi:predicted homoserine dehydrogenase-like protein
MRNKLTDLNDHLFEQLERLNNDDLKGPELEEEIKRAKAMSQVATQIVNGAKTIVDAMRIANSEGMDKNKFSKLLGE